MIRHHDRLIPFIMKESLYLVYQKIIKNKKPKVDKKARRKKEERGFLHRIFCKGINQGIADSVATGFQPQHTVPFFCPPNQEFSSQPRLCNLRLSIAGSLAV